MIQVVNGGYESRHKKKFKIFRSNGVPNYILLLVKTDACFEIDGIMENTLPNMAILYDRNTYTHYGCDQDDYINDWIHFDFFDEPSLVDQLHLPLNRPIYLPQLHHLSNYVRLLFHVNTTNSIHKQDIQDSLMRILLLSLDSQIKSLPELVNVNRHYQIFDQLKSNIHNTPHQKWTVDTMASFVHMSPYYFQHLYKEFFHISCMQEVILARMERARFYLSTTDLPVKTIALQCGYENDLHFVRQFKKKEGLTPTQYRKLNPY